MIRNELPNGWSSFKFFTIPTNQSCRRMLEDGWTAYALLDTQEAYRKTVQLTYQDKKQE